MVRFFFLLGIKYEALSSVLSLFRNEFNKINNTGERSESLLIFQQLSYMH